MLQKGLEDTRAKNEEIIVAKDTDIARFKVFFRSGNLFCTKRIAWNNSL